MGFFSTALKLVRACGLALTPEEHCFHDKSCCRILVDPVLFLSFVEPVEFAPLSSRGTILIVSGHGIELVGNSQACGGLSRRWFSGLLTLCVEP